MSETEQSYPTLNDQLREARVNCEATARMNSELVNVVFETRAKNKQARITIIILAIALAAMTILYVLQFPRVMLPIVLG